jgi:glycosyltransferase involved in cell wall biosynthesis
MSTHKRVSLVIPVYNEAEQIHDCLMAIAAQMHKPFEVIVVDNNSIDGSAAIARSFPFVTVLHEAKQGVVHARDRGFNAARGDIIGRIDADTLIPRNWIATVQQLFTEDPSLGAVSGTMLYRDVALAQTVNRVDAWWRARMAKLLGDEVGLQGASMALHRSVWQSVRGDVCHDKGLHEDLDLCIHANALGFTMRFDARLVASVCFRQANYKLGSFRKYALLCPQTYKQHGRPCYRKMYQLIAFVLVMYPVIKVISKGYDSRTGRFSFAKLMGEPVVPRVNPATYVD